MPATNITAIAHDVVPSFLVVKSPRKGTPRFLTEGSSQS